MAGTDVDGLIVWTDTQDSTYISYIYEYVMCWYDTPGTRTINSSISFHTSEIKR